ncbi:MAG TPA: adenosylmethionine--8-amino-7-oxononanoate transaminase [Pseudolabrys sp.]|nr:adenosylmethionine--8-amino-7-oxononanoate transaminase [Pseudolabrys sp.]
MSTRGGGIPDWYAVGLEHVWLPYAQMKTSPLPAPVIRTEGSRIVLADGRELVDGIASWWTACHGYNHPYIRQALESQLRTMPHVMFGGLAHEQAFRLAERLSRLLPGDLTRVFFSDSGSVAVEVALKMARQYWVNRGVAGKEKFIAFRRGYHGDTAGAMAVCDSESGLHFTASAISSGQYIVDLPRDQESSAALAKLLQAKAGEIAAIIVEPLVQGARGMVFHEPGVLRTLRLLADEHDLLLIFDEVFTAFGRTGSMFACEQAAVTPDIMTVSKALTGGTLPLAATVATRRVFDAFWSDDPERALMHGPTFMANALACAAANASLDLFEQEPRAQQVSDIAAALEKGLAPCSGMPGVTNVRVKGAIGVVELDKIEDLDVIRCRFLGEGVFIRPIENVVYITPAFTISMEELGVLTGAVVKVVGELRR